MLSFRRRSVLLDLVAGSLFLAYLTVVGGFLLVTFFGQGISRDSDVDADGFVTVKTAKMSLSDLTDVSLDFCFEFGPKRSFYSLFGVGNDTVSQILDVLHKDHEKIPDYRAALESAGVEITDKEFEYFDDVIDRHFYRKHHEQLLQTLDRTNSIAFGPEKITSTSFLMDGDFWGDKASLNTREMRLMLVPLLSSGGVADEEDVILSAQILSEQIDDGSEMEGGTFVTRFRRAKSFGRDGHKGLVCHNLRATLNRNRSLSHLSQHLSRLSSARILLDLERYDDYFPHLPARPMVGINAGRDERWKAASFRVWPPKAGVRRAVKVVVMPEYADFELGLYGEDQSCEVSFAVGDESEIDPENLTIFERCRLIRQLSRRCKTPELNRFAGLEGRYPGICDAVGDFYTEFKFSDCLDEERFPIRDNFSAWGDYVFDNLSLLDVSFRYEPLNQNLEADFVDDNW